MSYYQSNFDRSFGIVARSAPRYRSLIRLTEPVTEPVSIADAKQHLRIDADFTDDDLYIQSLITASRYWAENYVDRTFLRTQLQMRMDFFPFWDLPLPRPPVMPDEVVVQYTPSDAAYGYALTSFTNFRTDREATPAVIRPQWNGTWPTCRGAENDVVITWWAGYGTTGSDVPVPARHAMLLVLSHWYRAREAVSDSRFAPVPMSAETLLGSVNWGQYK
jgi:uncharacterized phiE125 gp8 family phage protein